VLGVFGGGVVKNKTVITIGKTWAVTFNALTPIAN